MNHVYRHKFDPVTKQFGTAPEMKALNKENMEKRWYPEKKMVYTDKPKKYFNNLPVREGKAANTKGAPAHTYIACPVCNGTGERADARTGKMRTCLICNGDGAIKRI